MTLAAGTKLSHYDILGPIGAGAMGEVYRAKDSKLGREVAIKVLPEHFADDEERLKRFEREAKTLASLNHPNVAQIFGVDQVGDTCFLVLELVPGESLEERLKRGPLSIDETLDVCRQIAEGLEAAHEAGVIHRDLKPANIRLTPEGKVKVLDFGLAKPANESGSGSSTDSVLSTEAGRLLGTPTYMAPEQARGKSIDKRVDIWAFGCVLYECLTAKRAFAGETLTDVFAAVIEREPDWTKLPAATPPRLHELLQRCFAKDPRARLRDVGEARLLLADARVVRAEELPARTRGWVPWTITAGALLLAAALVLLRERAAVPVQNAPAARVFKQRTFGQQFVFNARFLPRTQNIVFSSALTGNRPELFLLQAGTMAPQRIAPVGTLLLSVSLQGELAVLTDTTYLNHRICEGTLGRMTIDGSPRALIDSVRDADWGPDGELAIVRRVAGLDQLEYPPGKTLYQTTGYVSEPRVSPDGARVAFLDHSYWLDDRGCVKIADRAGKVTLLSGEYAAIEGLAWSPDGARLHSSGAEGSGSDVLQPFSTASDRADVRAEPSTPGDLFLVDSAADGRLLALQTDVFYGVGVRMPGQVEDIELSWLDQCWSSQLSPDGGALLFTNGHGGPNYTVVTRRLDQSPISTLGDGDAQGFSPDGRWVAAVVSTPSDVALYPTGAGTPRKLEHGPIERFAAATWFPDGKSLMVLANEHARPVRCFRQSVDGGKPEPLTPEGVGGTLAPRGDLILAQDAESHWKLYPLDGGAVRDLASIGPREEVMSWSPEGDALYVHRRGEIPVVLERVDLATGKRSPAFTLGPANKAGLVRVGTSERSIDPQRSYGYGYIRRLSKLFVIEAAQ